MQDQYHHGFGLHLLRLQLFKALLLSLVLPLLQLLLLSLLLQLLVCPSPALLVFAEPF
jgi:hypothetical protein